MSRFDQNTVDNNQMQKYQICKKEIIFFLEAMETDRKQKREIKQVLIKIQKKEEYLLLQQFDHLTKMNINLNIFKKQEQPPTEYLIADSSQICAKSEEIFEEPDSYSSNTNSSNLQLSHSGSPWADHINQQERNQSQREIKLEAKHMCIKSQSTSKNIKMELQEQSRPLVKIEAMSVKRQKIENNLENCLKMYQPPVVYFDPEEEVAPSLNLETNTSQCQNAFKTQQPTKLQLKSETKQQFQWENVSNQIKLEPGCEYLQNWQCNWVRYTDSQTLLKENLQKNTSIFSKVEEKIKQLKLQKKAKTETKAKQQYKNQNIKEEPLQSLLDSLNLKHQSLQPYDSTVKIYEQDHCKKQIFKLLPKEEHTVLVKRQCLQQQDESSFELFSSEEVESQNMQISNNGIKLQAKLSEIAQERSDTDQLEHVSSSLCEAILPKGESLIEQSQKKYKQELKENQINIKKENQVQSKQNVMKVLSDELLLKKTEEIIKNSQQCSLEIMPKYQNGLPLESVKQFDSEDQLSETKEKSQKEKTNIDRKELLIRNLTKKSKKLIKQEEKERKTESLLKFQHFIEKKSYHLSQPRKLIKTEQSVPTRPIQGHMMIGPALPQIIPSENLNQLPSNLQKLETSFNHVDL